MLTGYDIRREWNNNDIKISPFKEERLNPNSYNLSIGHKLLEVLPNAISFDGIEYIDPDIPSQYIEHDITYGFIMMPNKLYLGTTEEVAGSESYVPMLSGRSSIARHGVEIHRTAGFGDIGFIGQWTLEITTILPYKITAKDIICQIYFELPIGIPQHKYNGKYQGQRGPTCSKLHTELNR